MPIVIIPAYKPDQTFVTIADQLWVYGCQMVVVDDGSGKEYQQIFDKVRDICTILKHPENRGKGAAIKTALQYIKEEVLKDTYMPCGKTEETLKDTYMPYGKTEETLKDTYMPCGKTEETWDSDLVGIMDCDGQHLPEDMLKLLKAAGMHRKTLVLGVRNVGKEMPLKSRLGNQITRAVFQMVSGVKVSDTQTGLRAFEFEMIPDLLLVEGERYEYEMNVLMTCAKKKIPIKGVPIRTIYRDKNNSNSHFRCFVDSVRVYREILTGGKAKV